MCMYISVISLVYWSLWTGYFLRGYGVMNSCMFTCVVSHLIGLQVECSATIVETLSYGVWRNPLLSCRWSFGHCRGCWVYLMLLTSSSELLGTSSGIQNAGGQRMDVEILLQSNTYSTIPVSCIGKAVPVDSGLANLSL
jgi:hypothetical protein